jgi:hypothetical protein
MAEENIMTKQSVGWLEMTNYTDDPFPSGKSTRRGLAFINGSLYYWSGSDFVALGTTSGGVTTFDDLYDNDKALTLDDGVLTFTVTTAANGIYINKTNAGAGVPLVIGNSGSGYDIQGPAWSIISTGSVGILELTSAGTINATGGALTIGKTATATTFAGTVTINEGLSTADGAVTFTDNSNAAASVSIVNATATTYAGVFKVTAAAVTSGTGILATFAGLTTGLGLSIVASATTTGTLLKLSATEATLTTGKYIDCYDGAATDFSVARYGAVTIAGLAANNMITLTAGDIVISDGSITLTDADNAPAISVTANSVTTSTSGAVAIAANGLTSGYGFYVSHTTAVITTGSVVKITSTSIDTGTAQGTLVDLVSSGTTAGTVVGLTCAALATGIGILGTFNALTTGQAVSIASSATAITTTGRLFLVTHSGTTGTTATLSEFVTAATDETTIVGITASAALALGTALSISLAAMTTGTGVKIATLAALTTGIGFSVASSATAITGAGRLIYSNHTGATSTSGTLNEFATAATDETILFGLTSTGALALGKVLNIVADSCTTGFGIDMSMDALVTGVMINLHSDSADTTARSLVHIHNDNTAAVGAIPLEIVNDAVTGTGSKFIATIKLGGNTIWRSIDGTTPHGALTATAGDVCLNCDATSHKMMVCTGTDQWAAVTG